MKYLLLPFLLVFLLSCCTLNRYSLDDEGKDKTFLIQKIEDLSKDGQISKKPILVIDGNEYVDIKEIDLVDLNLSKKDIKEIELLKRNAAIRVFGESGERGVLLITTKKNFEETEQKKNN